MSLIPLSGNSDYTPKEMKDACGTGSSKKKKKSKGKMMDACKPKKKKSK